MHADCMRIHSMIKSSSYGCIKVLFNSLEGLREGEGVLIEGLREAVGVLIEGWWEGERVLIEGWREEKGC